MNIGLKSWPLRLKILAGFVGFLLLNLIPGVAPVTSSALHYILRADVALIDRQSGSFPSFWRELGEGLILVGVVNIFVIFLWVISPPLELEKPRKSVVLIATTYGLIVTGGLVAGGLNLMGLI
jgi:hypothetical protein